MDVKRVKKAAVFKKWRRGIELETFKSGRKSSLAEFEVNIERFAPSALRKMNPPLANSRIIG
jgi:hypothetical protein